MARVSLKNGNDSRSTGTTKYDAHHTVLSKTYGALADLRRELSDSREAVAQRGEILAQLASCGDSQRAWLLLEDYFEKLSLSRKDFAGEDWWPRLMAVRDKDRLEQLAFLFLRAHRPLPTELLPHANLNNFAEMEEAEEEQRLMQELERWLFPPAPAHLDSPRAALRVICEALPESEEATGHRHRLGVQFHLFRPRTGEKRKTLSEIMELTTRAAHEQELFQPADWEFIQWLAETHSHCKDGAETFVLSELDLMHWLARWGQGGRLELAAGAGTVHFHGAVAELTPHLENGTKELSFAHRLTLPDGQAHPLGDARFFSGRPPLALVGDTFYLLRNAPPPALLDSLSKTPSVPVRKLSHRLLKHLRKTKSSAGAAWEQLCVVHAARPQFVFELLDDTVHVRLRARSERDQAYWLWNGHEWQLEAPRAKGDDKPEILDDPRLEPATQWLRKLDWFTPEPGLWVGDANEIFLSTLGEAWPKRPGEADYLGNPAFHRLFLTPRQLRPRVVVKGTGIDWLSVSAEWEQEGLKLTAADLQRLQTATGRFLKLPDSGWVELDAGAVQSAHETMADLGVDGLIPMAQRIGIEQAAHLGDEELKRFAETAHAQVLRERLKDFKGTPKRRCRPPSAPIYDRIKKKASISFAISRKSNSAAFLRTTWAWERRCKRWRGWRGCANATPNNPSRRW